MTHFANLPPVPYNEEIDSESTSLRSNWDDMSSAYGSLKAIDGYDDTTSTSPYEYVASDGFSLHTFADSMLAISDQKPFKYVSLYFPTKSGEMVLDESRNWRVTIDAPNHIGIGFNVSSLHSLPIAINMASNLALKSVDSTAEITTYIQPLPTTKQQTASEQRVEGMLAVSFISFGLAFFPVAVIYNIVYERQTLAKLQLLVSGTNSAAYWLGTYLFDIIVVLPPSLFALILVEAFGASAFTGDAMGAFFLILFFYGLSIIPFTYLFSWLFSSSVKAQYIALITYLVLGYFLALATFILDIFPSTRDASDAFRDNLLCTLNSLTHD